MRGCIAAAVLCGCATFHAPPAGVGPKVLVKWPAAVSGIPPSADTRDVAGALPESIAGELTAQGLQVARIESDPHDVTATASLQLEQEVRIDPFTTRPVKGRYRGVARLLLTCSDGTSGAVQIDFYDQRLDLMAAMDGPPLARALISSEQLLRCAPRRHK
jgi:hypothetical protein